jgi:hypothetical protein
LSFLSCPFVLPLVLFLHFFTFTYFLLYFIPFFLYSSITLLFFFVFLLSIFSLTSFCFFFIFLNSSFFFLSVVHPFFLSDVSPPSPPIPSALHICCMFLSNPRNLQHSTHAAR